MHGTISLSRRGFEEADPAIFKSYSHGQSILNKAIDPFPTPINLSSDSSPPFPFQSQLLPHINASNRPIQEKPPTHPHFSPSSPTNTQTDQRHPNSPMCHTTKSYYHLRPTVVRSGRISAARKLRNLACPPTTRYEFSSNYCYGYQEIEKMERGRWRVWEGGIGSRW